MDALLGRMKNDQYPVKEDYENLEIFRFTLLRHNRPDNLAQRNRDQWPLIEWET